MTYNNYMYAIDRSDKYLEHYGIKGMKWGVRKAIESGNRVALSRQYKRAARKLAKLSLNANRNLHRERYKEARKKILSGAISSALVSAAGTGALNKIRGIPTGPSLHMAGLAAGAGALGGALLNAKGVMSRRYITRRGHEKAISKRNEFRKEMEKTFRNTGIGSNKDMHRFHDQIVSLSDQKNPKRYFRKQLRKSKHELMRRQFN
jgi:hypothetical protein